MSIEKDFCYNLRDLVSSDIAESIRIDKINMYEDLFLKSTAIDWVHKPLHIDMVNVVNILLDNLKCYKISNKHIYMIGFDKKQFPNTRNSIDSIVRFLDKGNENFPGIHTFSTVFNKYENNINEYWESQILISLHRLPVSEVLVIK